MERRKYKYGDKLHYTIYIEKGLFECVPVIFLAYSTKGRLKVRSLHTGVTYAVEAIHCTLANPEQMRT